MLIKRNWRFFVACFAAAGYLFCFTLSIVHLKSPSGNAEVTGLAAGGAAVAVALGVTAMITRQGWLAALFVLSAGMAGPLPILLVALDRTNQNGGQTIASVLTVITALILIMLGWKNRSAYSKETE